jgi:hypothetical protein
MIETVPLPEKGKIYLTFKGSPLKFEKVILGMEELRRSVAIEKRK